MTQPTHKPLPFRPLLTAAGLLLVLLTLLATAGCKSAPTDTRSSSMIMTGEAFIESHERERIEQDRAAILGMAGEYKVSFDFHEVLVVRDGYDLAEPYHAEATELVKVIEDRGDFISLQHLLVVWMDDEPHVVKHWRQDWTYQGTQLYDYQGENRWSPTRISAGDAEGAWVQSVFQVDDSPRYWGVAKWVHQDGVSTWSAQTNRPLPRRESTKRDDYQVMGAVNAHIVTAEGWVHEQQNRKIDIHNDQSPVIAIEIGVNTYTRTDEVNFAAAEEYWQNTHAYWAQVRAVWDEVYAQRKPIHLEERWRGDTMFTHLFDLADLYWGEADVSDAPKQIREIVDAFLSRPVAAR